MSLRLGREERRSVVRRVGTPRASFPERRSYVEIHSPRAPGARNAQSQCLFARATHRDRAPALRDQTVARPREPCHRRRVQAAKPVSTRPTRRRSSRCRARPRARNQPRRAKPRRKARGARRAMLAGPCTQPTSAITPTSMRISPTSRSYRANVRISPGGGARPSSYSVRATRGQRRSE
jgi:hypothetical protein